MKTTKRQHDQALTLLHSFANQHPEHDKNIETEIGSHAHAVATSLYVLADVAGSWATGYHSAYTFSQYVRAMLIIEKELRSL